MGIQLMQSALSPAWAGLSDRARLVLIIMSRTALDKPRKGELGAVYFGGHRSLAQALRGRDDVEEWEVKKVQRAISELRKAGAITVLRPGMNGRPPEYRLNLIPHQEQLI